MNSADRVAHRYPIPHFGLTDNPHAKVDGIPLFPAPSA